MVTGRTGAPLRLVFFGTPTFAVPSLERLLASRHVVAGVVTQPDRPRGRGHRVTAAPIKEVALAHDVPVLQPIALRAEFVDALSRVVPDLGVVAAYGRILPEAVLNVPRLGMINVHASLLPKYRGAAPVHRAVIAGEPETGVTIMRVVKELDAGPMLASRRRAIAPDETSDLVERELALLGADLLLESIEDLAVGSSIERPQNPAQATYAPRITRADGAIDWTRPARAIHNQVRGLHPWPHAFSFFGDQRVLLLRTAVNAEFSHNDDAPGTIGEAGGDRLIVATGDGAVRVLSLQLEGGRPLTAREFLAGHRVTPGSTLSAGPSG